MSEPFFLRVPHVSEQLKYFVFGKVVHQRLRHDRHREPFSNRRLIFSSYQAKPCRGMLMLRVASREHGTQPIPIL